MKFLAACVFLLFLSSPVSSQTQLQLILNTDVPIDSVYVVHWTDKEVAHLPFTNNMTIRFKTRGIDFYHLNYMIKGKGYYAPLMLDTGHIKIISHLDDKKIIVDSVEGSPFYKKYTQWRTDYTALKSNKDSVALDLFLLKTYEDNIDNLFSFTIGNRYLDIHQNNKIKLYALLPLIAKQSAAVKEYFGYSILNERLQGIIKNDIVRFTDYPLTDIYNTTATMQAFKAKYVILDFWFVGCLPCLEDHKKLASLLPILKQKQTEFISISNDDDYKKWKDYLDKYQFRWQHYKKIAGDSNVIEQLGISTYPTYILLDQKGKILYSSVSLEEVLGQLK